MVLVIGFGKKVLHQPVVQPIQRDKVTIMITLSMVMVEMTGVMLDLVCSVCVLLQLQ